MGKINQGSFNWSQPQNIPTETATLFSKELEYEEGSRFRELQIPVSDSACDPQQSPDSRPCPAQVHPSLHMALNSSMRCLVLHC